MQERCTIKELLHKMEMDSFDLAIAMALQKDASLTNAQLSEIANLSPSQCSRRKGAMERAGLIEGYGARLNAKAFGRSLRAIVRVNLSQHSHSNDNSFTRFVEGQDEISDAYSVSGDCDYVLNVAVKDLEQFAKFVHQSLLPHPDVSQVRSEIVLMTLKTG